MSDNPFIKAKKQFTLPGTGKGKPTGNTLLQKARDLSAPTGPF
jgi:hypothetical protein